MLYRFALVLLALFAAPAATVIDFDSLAGGAAVTNQFAGLTLQCAGTILSSKLDGKVFHTPTAGFDETEYLLRLQIARQRLR